MSPRERTKCNGRGPAASASVTAGPRGKVRKEAITIKRRVEIGLRSNGNKDNNKNNDINNNISNNKNKTVMVMCVFYLVGKMRQTDEEGRAHKAFFACASA